MKLINSVFLGKPLSLIQVISHQKQVNNGPKRKQPVNALKKPKVIFINLSIKMYVLWA